eukprot:SAG11_NODE_1843_length_4179_cov_2.361520_1_plen_533_part_00
MCVSQRQMTAALDCRPCFISLLCKHSHLTGGLSCQVQIKYRLAFWLFCFMQQLIRVFTLCAVVLLLTEHCAKDSVSYCGETHSTTLLVVLFGMAEWGLSMIVHVIHLQGHLGGSLGACFHDAYYEDEVNTVRHLDSAGRRVRRRRPICGIALRMSMLSKRTFPAYLIGFLNIIVACETQPFSVLRNADPRPPRLLFFLIRLTEICFSGYLFENALRSNTKLTQAANEHMAGSQSVYERPLPYPFDFDGVFTAGIGLLVSLYLGCLLIPHQLREAAPQALQRALTVGVPTSVLNAIGASSSVSVGPTVKAGEDEGVGAGVGSTAVRTARPHRRDYHGIRFEIGWALVLVTVVSLVLMLLHLNKQPGGLKWGCDLGDDKLDINLASPCLNGATCAFVANDGSLLRRSTKGHPHAWAEYSDTCAPHMAAAFSRLQHGPDSYVCVCPYGYEGDRCQTINADQYAAINDHGSSEPTSAHLVSSDSADAVVIPEDSSSMTAATTSGSNRSLRVVHYSVGSGLDEDGIQCYDDELSRGP